jgi:hypothetical protein
VAQHLSDLLAAKLHLSKEDIQSRVGKLSALFKSKVPEQLRLYEMKLNDITRSTKNFTLTPFKKCHSGCDGHYRDANYSSDC